MGPRRNPKCAVLETRRAHFAFRPRLAARCHHVSHAARIAAPCPLADKPAVLSAVSACRRFSDHARPPPLCRPRPPFKWSAVSRKATSEALPGDRPSCRLCSGSGNPLRRIPGPSQQSTLRRRTTSSPNHPRNGPLPQSRRRNSRQRTAVPNQESLFLSNEEPQPECARISPPGAPNAALASAPPAQHLSACPTTYPRQQRGEGPSRSYPGRTSPRARHTGCPCTFCLWQPVCLDSPSPHKLPP